MSKVSKRIKKQKIDKLISRTHQLTIEKNYSLACHEFKVFLKNNPITADIANDYGVNLLAVGEIESAIDYFEKAVTLNKKNADYYYNLGNAYLRAGIFEKAITALSHSNDMSDNDAETLNSLGESYMLTNDLDTAYKYFHASLQQIPDRSETLYNLAKLFELRNDLTTSQEILKISLNFNPDNPVAQHALYSAANENIEHASFDFIKRVFDRYSPYFENHLCETLKYQVPEIIANLLSQIAIEKMPFSNVLDLGCGTGLMAEALKAVNQSITGVDLSSGMLSVSRKKNLYKMLHEKEILEFLKDNKEKYDLIVAADVLIYMGDLAPYFAAIRDALAEQAIFTFSLELTNKQDYYLQHSGRFAHSKQYVEKIIHHSSFKIIHIHDTAIRAQYDKPIDGVLYFLQAI